MRRFSVFLLSLLLALAAGAQTRDPFADVAADILNAAGCERPYHYEPGSPTAAPKGYKPFYISHYGRHGSRYCWNNETYIFLHEVLTEAKKHSALTDEGERFRTLFEEDYPEFLANTGDLSELGFAQQRDIAVRMAASFPEVFVPGGKVFARCSPVPRVISSMQAFTVSLQKSVPSLDIRARALHTDCPVVNPHMSLSEEQAKAFEPLPRPGGLSDLDFWKPRACYDTVLPRFFTDDSFFSETGGRTKFIMEVFRLWANSPNCCEDPGRYSFLLTPEEAAVMWEAFNFSNYYSIRYYQLYDELLQDIVAGAQAAINGGGFAADLRFGHDTIFDPLCYILMLDGRGGFPEEADEVKGYYFNYLTPMAANLQIVLYRSRKNPEILFKVLRNEKEQQLPQLESAGGPYYRWSDFTAWIQGYLKDHKL